MCAPQHDGPLGLSGLPEWDVSWSPTQAKVGCPHRPNSRWKTVDDHFWGHYTTNDTQIAEPVLNIPINFGEGGGSLPWGMLFVRQSHCWIQGDER